MASFCLAASFSVSLSLLPSMSVSLSLSKTFRFHRRHRTIASVDETNSRRDPEGRFKVPDTLLLGRRTAEWTVGRKNGRKKERKDGRTSRRRKRFMHGTVDGWRTDGRKKEWTNDGQVNSRNERMNERLNERGKDRARMSASNSEML